jgi:hypothetical protein
MHGPSHGSRKRSASQLGEHPAETPPPSSSASSGPASTSSSTTSSSSSSSSSEPRGAGARLRRQLVRQPYVTLSVAGAAGFLLAGGLTSPALWGLARLGARLAVVAAAREFDAVFVTARARSRVRPS